MNLGWLGFLLPCRELLDPSVEVVDPGFQRFDGVIAEAPGFRDLVLINGMHNLFEVFGDELQTLDSSFQRDQLGLNHSQEVIVSVGLLFQDDCQGL